MAEGSTGLNASDAIPSKIYCIQFWAVSQQKDTYKSGRIQGEAPRCTVGPGRLIGTERKKKNPT